jgi:hypothetical protein
MLSEKEVMLVRNHVADFCVDLIDTAITGSKEDTLKVMENFANFLCHAFMEAKKEGRSRAMITTTN